ncbi:thermonuclease family protein [Pseudenhygromyxa sp. WMMC2535]|uniref:thermonuclease family protein n=1 Tax=Pseudenhygromyxa sp. WMMC2535 TaxID=2712867 RepID=UPI001552F3BA|nr:thermonuclease family protein [Pseudenhygromyxa sp. WMMC2535]NVB36200.1 thermonuclease family protein [Pseudenhygromyxa sp. WMMC2535]NVB43399.1 thermonuclease family protein [Pseudenhygromyxa sp. WMMC2535]
MRAVGQQVTSAAARLGSRTLARVACAAGLIGLAGLAGLGCAAEEGDEGDGGSSCGPSEAVVARVIDGDTVELEGGERVRYLMIDAPESTDPAAVECWGPEAAQANTDLVEGQTVSLRYDVECEDTYGRLLAYVELKGRVINELLVERGHACVLHIPPNGEDELERYEDLEYAAEQLDKGLWAVCEPRPC